MRTCGPVAIFCGALWDATVCRPAKLRWSRNLNRDSRACRNTGELGNRLLVLRPLDYVTKLVSGPLACELPLYGNPVAIHTTIPGPSLLAQASDVSDSAFA